MRDYLFTQYDIAGVLEGQRKTATDAIQNLDPNYLLNADEAQLVAALADEYRLEVPVVRDDEIHVADHGEASIDVRGDPNRPIFDRSRPFLLPGTRTTIAVPFVGNPEFFEVRPQTYTQNPPRGKVVGAELLLVYERVDHDAAVIKAEYQRTVGQVKSYLESLQKSAEGFNQGLESLLRDAIRVRKTKLLADAGMVEALGLPMRKREGAATTYAVPLQRRRPKIERPVASTAKFQPEPVLAQEEYESILSIVKNMVRVMEKSPRAFEGMQEEDLRTHFLVQLNAQYEGQATAETFNYDGKTDILIRVEGKNVFIAECKFWNGEKAFRGTIDQLLSYLSWRDTKTAVLVFSRKTGFTEVLKKIAATLPMHSQFVRDLGKTDESTFRSIFKQPNDPDRHLFLTVMAFDVPRANKG